MNYVVTLLPEQHQCNDDDNDDMTDDHYHRYILDACDFGHDLQKKKCLLKFTDTVVVLCVCIRLCVGSRGYKIGDNSYEAQCGWVQMGSPRQRPEFTDNNDYAA